LHFGFHLEFELCVISFSKQIGGVAVEARPKIWYVAHGFLLALLPLSHGSLVEG